MKTKRFEVGKAYKVNGAVFVTVIDRSEKTVTFRVFYRDSENSMCEDTVKKKIFMSGGEETFFIEYTKTKNDADFSNAYDEYDYERLTDALEQIEDELERHNHSFSDLMFRVSEYYGFRKSKIRYTWRIYAQTYLIEKVREIVDSLIIDTDKEIACCHRDTIIREYINSLSELDYDFYK